MMTTDIDERNEKRDDAILDAAARVIERDGLSALTRDAVAEEANLSPASVSNFGRTRITNGTHDRSGYRARILHALMWRAIGTRNLSMIRIGLADGCLKRADLSDDLLVAIDQ